MKGTLRQKAFAKVTSAQAIKQNKIQTLFSTMAADAEALGGVDFVFKAFERLRQYHDDMHTGAKDP